MDVGGQSRCAELLGELGACDDVSWTRSDFMRRWFVDRTQWKMLYRRRPRRFFKKQTIVDDSNQKGNEDSDMKNST